MEIALNRKRQYTLGIWALGLGYFIFYTPYSALTKAASQGLFPGLSRPVAGPALLPVSVAATIAGIFAIITFFGWWHHAGTRKILGFDLPCPNRWTFLSAVCIATIIGTTTLAFTFDGISVLFVLALLRGGVLILGPIVDALMKRNVRWFSWAGMWFSVAAILVILVDVKNYRVTLWAAVDIAAYLAAYFFRFQFMTRLAKSRDSNVALRYFVEEQIVATPLLLAMLGLVAVVGPASISLPLRTGFQSFAGNETTLVAVLIGLSYAALCTCTTLIFLDRRENTFCIPVHCGSSMLAGIVAAYFLSTFTPIPAPAVSQLVSASLIVVALLFLSPLHHLSAAELRITFARYQQWLASAPFLQPAVSAPAGKPIAEPIPQPQPGDQAK
jgi:hypothetical protein